MRRVNRNVNRNRKKQIKEPNPVECVPSSPCFISTTATNFTIDYIFPENYDYSRYSPDYFRYVDPNAPTYPEYYPTLISDTTYGCCLRSQLRDPISFTAAIQFWATEVLYIKLLPIISDTQEDKDYKDSIRNRWFAFILNIEKSYIYYNKSLTTCNNQLVPWESTFTREDWAYRDTDPVEYGKRYISSRTKVLQQIDQTILYSLSVNYFANFFDTGSNIAGRRKTPFNPNYILGLLNGTIQVDSPLLTQVNFYEIIFLSYQLLTQIFSISNKLLNGLDPGLPKEFIEKFYPRERQLLYYNTYLTWIQSRQGYLGFGGMKINSGNGSSTNIQIPNNLILKNIN